MNKILYTLIGVISLILTFGIIDIAQSADFKRINNNTIELTGEITQADKYRFDYQISQLDNPNKFNLILNSPGGNAQGMFDLLTSFKDREITTIVKKDAICMSACAILWTFGDDRLLYNGGEIGFHVASVTLEGVKYLTEAYGLLGFQSLIQESFADYIRFYSQLPVKDGIALAFKIATEGYNSDNFFVLSPTEVREIIGGRYIN